MRTQSKNQSESICRCINLDWLEVYTLEPLGESPRNAEYFRSVGFIVKEREYGTPIYHEMFTIMDEHDLPLIEVRRNPKSAAGIQPNGILDPRASHIRLSNRTCYRDDAATLMQQFIDNYHYQLIRISRIDICLDFEKFDSGDLPQKFLQRYVSGKYSKLNQSKVALHGLDNWDGRAWNSVKWGNLKSMVNTKLYNKTMELRERADKPYIRQAWYLSGLIDDWHTGERYDENGKAYRPEIWRLEFSIKSGVKNWFVVENPYNTKPRLRSIRHTLQQYETKAQLMDVFLSLCDHYFHFKKVVYLEGNADSGDRKLQRKDRCPDKVLFDKSTINKFYKVAQVTTAKKVVRDDERLLKYLYKYQETIIEREVHKAIYTIIEHLESRLHREDISGDLDSKTVTMMRILIAKRMKNNGIDITKEMKSIKTMLEQYKDLFGEID